MAVPITHAVAGAPIDRVALSHDNRWLAAYYPNEDWQLVLRPLHDPEAANVPVGIQSRGPDFCFLPNRPLLLVADSNYLKVCDPNEPAPAVVPLVPAPIYPIGAFVVTTDGRAVIVGRSKPYVSAGSAAVARWDVTPGMPVTRSWQKRVRVERDLPPRGLGLLSREKAFAAVERYHDAPNNCWVEEVVVFDAGTGARRFTLPPPADVPQPGYEIHALAVNPHEPFVAGIVLGHLIVWNTKVKSNAPARISRPERIRDLAFHPDGHTLFAVTWEGVFRYDTRNWAETRLDAPVSGRPTCVAVAPDGRLLVVGTMEGTVTVCAS